SATVAPAEPLEVQVTTDGTIRLNGLRLSLGQLSTEIAARIKGDQESSVTIKADAEVPVQVLVQIMDQLQSAGVDNLRLATPEAS
ncbi:MAG TPA: protein TolR, partial [Alphaproteobacteria bacterium]|nr:protein TolR [Alphaproteobacteria bacterium]